MQNDLISRSALIEVGTARKIIEVVGNWDELPGIAKSACTRLGLAHKKLILDAPAVDAVALEILEGKMLKAVMQKQDGVVVEFLPVVRCKDCKWALPNEASNDWVNCGNCFETAQRKDWYCADGERREDDG